MSARNQRSLANEITLAQQQSRDEVASIANWYQLRRNQAMMELERLENAYNERMAEHSVEWAQRLSVLFQELEESVNPLVTEARQTTFELCSTTSVSMEVDHIPSDLAQDAIEQEMLDDSIFPPIPRLERQQNVLYRPPEERDAIYDFDYMTLPVAPIDLEAGLNIVEQREVAIVSDDEDEDEDEDAMDVEQRLVAIVSDDEDEDAM
jgi:hypothetical protein